ncbi:MAG: hydantoinase/oxoprolinase family protein [Paracoccaceae bacterium]|nr:hydantoinase/oxoprolinase family protein [Paracoccaceae bacterium]
MGGKITRVATDVGGTFTDLVCFETDPETGMSDLRIAKSDTTPPDFETGVLNVIEKSGVAPDEIDFLAHGTTIVINALAERTGVTVGLVTTLGFRDVLEIARGNRPDFFNLHYDKPPPFVPRYLRRELPGRITYLGEELQPLDLSPLPEIIDEFRSEGVQAIAICLLHSYADPTHELEVQAEVRRLWPDVPTVASHQITREWREYERTNTAVLSAYVQPVAERYLKKLDEGVRTLGFTGPLYVMQSNCGVDTVDSASRIPITMVESGPASGVWGAAELGKLIGERNIIALDIGGTTAKCSLVHDGHVKIVTDYWIERNRTSSGYPIMVPVVDMVEIGNGGGSVAHVDRFGKLYVGPQSAGALPGPAAYGKGGTEATTTDANLWLGRINHEFFCGGTLKADMAAAETAINAIGKKLRVGADDVARGIVRIANNNMVNALKLVSVNRGYDPRDFTLVAFGGGGPMHAVSLAQELGIRKVVVPPGAAVFSAWGMVMTDLRRDYFVTRLVDLVPDSAGIIETTFRETEDLARRQFEREGIEANRVRFVRYGQFRYQNQEHTTDVQIDIAEIGANHVSPIVERFHQTYEREYTYRLNAPVEMVGIHVVASAEAGRFTITEQPLGTADAGTAVKGTRDVDYALEGVHRATLYDGERLRPGMRFQGPAIIEDPGMTVVVHSGNRVRMDGFGNTHIELG